MNGGYVELVNRGKNKEKERKSLLKMNQIIKMTNSVILLIKEDSLPSFLLSFFRFSLNFFVSSLYSPLHFFSN